MTDAWTGDRYGHAALRSELRRVLDAGTRASVLKAAARMGELAAGNHLDSDYVRQRLIGAAVEAGRPRIEVYKAIEYGLRQGLQRPRSASTSGTMIRSRIEAILRVVTMMELAEVTNWPARRVTPKVLAGLHLMALRAGKVRIDTSFRELAEVAGVSVGSIGSSLAQLEGLWLRVVRTGSRSKAKSRTLIQLLLPKGPETSCAVLEHAGPRPAPVPPACSPNAQADELALLHPGHDLWARRTNAWRIFCALVAHAAPAGVVELVTHLGAKRRTVETNLRWLENLGLVEKDEDQWRALDLTDGARKVTKLGIARVGELRRQRHRDDRKHHKRRIAAIARGEKIPAVYTKTFGLARKGANPVPLYPPLPDEWDQHEHEHEHEHEGA